MMHLANETQVETISSSLYIKQRSNVFHAFNRSWTLKCLRIQLEIDIFSSSSPLLNV